MSVRQQSKHHNPRSDSTNGSNQAPIHELHRTLLQITMAINSELELDEVLRMIHDAAIDVGGFDRSGVWMVDGDFVRGSWGTDASGKLRDEKHLREPLSQWSPKVAALRSGASRFYLEDWLTDDAHRAVPIMHAVVGLVASGELVGLLSVDNLITGRSIAEPALEPLLLLAEQAAVAVKNSRLRKELELTLKRQRRLMEISAGINASVDLDEILRLVRDAVTEGGGFDRAGVYRIENEIAYGAWGTDIQGQPMREDGVAMPLSEWCDAIDKSNTMAYRIKHGLPESENGIPVGPARPYARIEMRAGGQVVGLLYVDNGITDRAILESDIDAILPITEQAAVAIQNATLLRERSVYLERQRRLAGLAAAISASTALDEILRMFHEAVVGTCGFDRAGVALYDHKKQALRGTWGTDRKGRMERQDHLELQMDLDDSSSRAKLLRGECIYILTSDFTEAYNLGPENKMYGVKEHAIVAIRAGGHVLGCLEVDNLISNRPISDEDMDVLISFADHAAVAIQNAHLFSELRQTQDALVRSEKMRAIGELASGVAHNMNNVLTAVLGYAELIKHDSETSDLTRRYAGVIERAALDGAEITRRLQQTARHESATGMEPFDLSDAIQETVALAHPIIASVLASRGARIKVNAKIEPKVFVSGNACEIREVVINLIRNAVDAMPDGGALTVECDRDTDHASVRVSDSGKGMDDVTRRRVFEPFYTTKGPGLGLGLGLSVAWGIINRHGGQIDVHSDIGNGSTFNIRLPLARKGTGAASVASSRQRLEGLRVLVVEDETFVADGLNRMLRASGAHVEVVADASEAIQWLNENATECEVVMSDHGMAGMTGLELLRYVRDLYPKVKRVLFSGWGASLPGIANADVADLILSKPIRLADLVAALKELSHKQ